MPDGIPTVWSCAADYFEWANKKHGEAFAVGVAIRDYISSTMPKKVRPGSYASSGAISRPLEQTPITGLDSFVRQPRQRVNPDTESKVIDPETGEPLVVYHATTKKFTAVIPK